MRKCIKGWVILLVVASLLQNMSCTTSKYASKRAYKKIWNEITQSEEWRRSLRSYNKEIPDLYVSIENDYALLPKSSLPKNAKKFSTEYNALVARAYFKICAEADEADDRITREFKTLERKNRADLLDSITQTYFASTVTKKYIAHKAMIRGLKSWNIFSTKRSGDLNFFKLENREAIQEQMSRGATDEQLVHFLMYQLADLYHNEE